MAKPRTIQIYLPDGNPRGVKIAEITNRTIQAVFIPRVCVDFALSREELDNVGVYFLVGESEDSINRWSILVKIENCIDRLRQHNKRKDFWQYAIMMVSQTKSFTKSCVKYLEWYCHHQAEKAFLGCEGLFLWCFISCFYSILSEGGFFMSLADYVSGARQKLNDGVGKIPYFGKALTTDINPVVAGRAALSGLIIGSMTLNSGCGAVVGGYVGAKIAESGGSLVSQANDEAYGKLSVEYWKDFNGDGNLGKGEVLGEVENSVNLDDYGLRVRLINIGRRRMTFYALDSKGNRIGYTGDTSEKIWGTVAGHKTADSWMGSLDDISKRNPGEYTIYVERTERSGYPTIFKKKIIIERNE